jgi:hypothetical protein
LLLLGLGIAAGFIKLVFSALIVNPQHLLDGFTLNRKVHLIQELDREFKAGNFSKALAILEQSFFFSPRLGDTSIIEKIAAHHLEVLNRIVTFSDRHGFHLGPLPALEELLNTRSELFRAKYEVGQTIKTLNYQRIFSKHKGPNWALNEFKKKQADLDDRLGVNRQAIRTTVHEIFLILGNTTRGDSVTLH